jgi:hypothetical protein
LNLPTALPNSLAWFTTNLPVPPVVILILHIYFF